MSYLHLHAFRCKRVTLPGRPCHSLKGEAIPESKEQRVSDPSPFRNKASAGLAIKQKEACIYLAGTQTKKCNIIIYENQLFPDVTVKNYKFSPFNILLENSKNYHGRMARSPSYYLNNSKCGHKQVSLLHSQSYPRLSHNCRSLAINFSAPTHPPLSLLLCMPLHQETTYFFI